MKRDRNITDPQVAKALAHPLRVRILGLLEEGTASPSDLARELGGELSLVSYHVRRLEAAGLVKLVRRKQRRGAIEHYYKAVERPVITSDAWARTPSIVKQAMVRAVLSQVAEHVNAAANSGGFEREDAHLTRSPMVLDAEGWHEVAGRLDALLKDFEDIAARAEKRLAGADHEGAINATAVLMLMESVAPALDAAAPRRGRASKKRSTPLHGAPDRGVPD